MTQDEALADLQRMAASDDPPALTSDDLLRLLALARRPDRYGFWPDSLPDWAGGVAVAVGALILPSPRLLVYGTTVISEAEIDLYDAYDSANNLTTARLTYCPYYRATVAGTTDTTQPDWPLTAGATVADGGVTWQIAGRAYWHPTWDLNAAAQAAWQAKAAQAARMYNVKDNGQMLDRATVYDHCVKQAKHYGSRVMGTIVPGHVPADPVFGFFNRYNSLVPLP